MSRTQHIASRSEARSMLSACSRLSRVSLVGSCLLPFLARAEPAITVFENPDPALSFTGLADKISNIANTIIPFLIGVAFVAIIWGIFKYIRQAGDAEKLAEGKKMVIYGTIALFMMLSFWGFVMIIKNSLFGA